MNKNCVIYDKSFLDDLYSYKFDSSNGNKIIYSNPDLSNKESTSEVYLVNTINFIKNNIYKTKSDVWYPVFVNSSNSRINDMTLYKGTTTLSDNLGIQNAIDIFDPKFHNWEINESPYMSTDWIITPDLCPFYPVYGLMFWFKYNSIVNKPLSVEEIPIGSTVRLSSGPASVKINNQNINIQDIPLIKYDSETFLISEINSIIKNLQSDTFLPSAQYKYIKIDDMLNSDKKLKKENIKFVINPTSRIIEETPELCLWIPDGDTYSYFKSPQMKDASSQDYMCSSSYISPTLSNIYREVYHTLSWNKNTRNINGGIPQPNFSPLQSKLFKKLCHILSTYPLLDRTTVSILRNPDTASHVLKYINSKPKSVNDEIKLIQDVLLSITEKLNALSTDYMTNNQYTYSHGLVTTRDDLFNRLIFKYGSKLILEQKSELKYKPGLVNGPHVKINQEMTSRCSKGLQNTIVYNNMSISSGPFLISTEFSAASTKLKLNNKLKRNESFMIPLWDIEKSKFKNVRIPVTAGPDIDIDFGNQDVESLKEIEYSFETAAIDYNAKYDTSIIGSEQPDVLWRKISGPDCLRFLDPKQPSVRYETSTDESPTVFIKSPGKYILEVRVRTSFGIIYDTVTIYANGKIIDNGTAIVSYSRKQQKERLRPASVQYIQAKNNLSIMVPNIRECYIGKQGVFWPSYTDCSVKVPQGMADRDAPPGPGNSLPPEIIPLGNNYHKFSIPMTYNKDGTKAIVHGNVDFSIDYNCNNTTIELNRIILTNLNSHETDQSKNAPTFSSNPADVALFGPEYNSCESLYEGILDNRGFIVDGGSDAGGFIFMDPSDNDKTVDISAPDGLKTKRFAVKSYGGFSKQQLSQLGINIPFHPAVNSYLPQITASNDFFSGPKNEKDGKVTQLCHDTELPLNSSIEFSKGCFHPFHGWIGSDSPAHLRFQNLSSVVNFDPYNRAVQVFKGPGLYDLKNDFEDGKSKIYKSSITLSVDPEAYDPVGEEENKNPEIVDQREVSDHIDHYGYRSVGGNINLKMLNYNDEFKIDFPIIDDAPVSSDNYCSDITVEESNYSSSYIFTRPGSFIPFKDRKSTKRLRWRRQGGGNISNIEVKLNFLNYVNPKNLVVWLEIDSCALAADRLSPPSSEEGEGERKSPPPKDPWFKGSYYDKYRDFGLLPEEEDNGFGKSNKHIKQYISSLWNMNDNIPLDASKTLENFSGDPKIPRSSTYRIYLLNQDHIENYEYNINIKFSDLLDLFNNSSNNNIDSTLYMNNNISDKINNTIDLAPTLSAAGYDDGQVSAYKKIMIENKLLNNSHRFQKISGMPIFSQSPSAANKAGNSSETTFRLCVAVVDESDPFEPYDRILSTQELIGYNTCITKNRSNLVENSLCNWELIIHRTDNSNGFIPGDSLGNIKYEDDNPSIPGYSFIADLTDKLHLLPPSVINAPNVYTIDGRLCRYSKESLNVPKFSQPLPFVIFPLILMLPPSILGAVAALPGIEMAMNEQTRQIANYLHSLRRERQKDIFNRAWYVPNYDKYPVGSSDKILLSISKDNELFYKTEASIFRYNNSIIMKKHKHQFYKLHYNSYLRDLSIFKINLIDEDNFIKIIYNSYIKSLYMNDTETGVSPFSLDSMLKEDARLSAKTILTKDEEARLNKIKINIKNIRGKLEQSDIYQEFGNKDRKQVRIISGERAINNFKDLFYADSYIKHNNIFNLSKSDNDFDTLITEKRLYVMDGLRPYYFFQDNRDIVILTEKKPADIDNKKMNELKDKLNKLKEIKKIDGPELIGNEFKNLENEIFLMSYDIKDNYITNIGYVFDSGTYKTIVIFRDSPTGNIISISPEKSKRILILDDKTSIDGKSTLPLNFWSLNNHSSDHDIHSSQDIKESAWGVGNYGYGSNITTRYMLSQPDINSKIIPLIDRIHYNKNSTIDYNSFSSYFYYSQTQSMTNGTTVGCAFIYTLDNINNNINKYDNKLYADSNLKTLADPFLSNIDDSVYEHKSYGYMTEIDVLFNENDLSSDNGTITFDKDISPIKTILPDKDSKISDLRDRFYELNDLIKNKIEESKNLSKTYSLDLNKPISEKEVAAQDLQILYSEKNNIQYYLDYFDNIDPYANISSIPNISININKNDDGSLTITEKENNNLYWINIDPEQGCSIDKDRTIKILKKVQFECLQYNDMKSLNADSVCLDTTVPDILSGDDESLRNIGQYQTYELSKKLIEDTKAKYPNLKWPENNDINYVVERTFFLNFHGSERAQGITATYSYICPIGPSQPDVEPDGNVKNKIYNIFNLDKTEKLHVDFKRIPRLLRNKDTQFDMYEPNDVGALSKSIYPAPGGPIDGSFRIWKCIDSKTGQYVQPYSPYYYWLNEMLFRTYFGSVDGLEYQGRETVQSKDEGYWIPYDFN
jgi:hypothetical protein